MIRALFTALLFLALALLILLNSSYTTSFNLFGKVYEQVPIILVILISFFSGVVYLLLFYLYGKVLHFFKAKKKLKQEKQLEAIQKKTEREKPPSPGQVARPPMF